MTHASDDLARLRQRVIVRITGIELALTDRPTPWRDWQSVERQLESMGFRRVDSPEQTEQELKAMVAFLDAWADDLLIITEGIVWSDPRDDEAAD